MDADEMMDMVNLLDDQVDDMEEALAPLLKTSLQDIATKLPVVDKARLYVLTTYAIDSLLFSYLRLHGVNAREHPVMRELERVKQYVKKINEAQTVTTTEKKREVVLDKAVAARFVKHDLAGNDKWDIEHAAEKAREKAAAHAKFEELSRKIEKRRAENPEEEEAEEEVRGGEAGSGSESDEGGLKDKYRDEEVLTINDTEDGMDGKKSRNEEQVNRILDTFKNHGVAASPGSKRKFREDTSESTKAGRREKKKQKKERKEQRRLRMAEGGNKSSKNREEESSRKSEKRRRRGVS